MSCGGEGKWRTTSLILTESDRKTHIFLFECDVMRVKIKPSRLNSVKRPGLCGWYVNIIVCLSIPPRTATPTANGWKLGVGMSVSLTNSRWEKCLFENGLSIRFSFWCWKDFTLCLPWDCQKKWTDITLTPYIILFTQWFSFMSAERF